MPKTSLHQALLLLSIRIALVTGCIFVATFLATPSYGQNLYQHSPVGKQHFDRATDQIVIKFVKGTTFEAQQRILSAEKELQPITREQLLPSPKVTFAKLTPGTTQEAIDALMLRISSISDVVYANQVMIFSDGTRQVLQDEILVKLRTPSDLDRLKATAASMNTSIVRENEFERGLYHLLVAGSPGRALEVANAMHETGLFEFAEPDWIRMPKGFSTNDPYYNYQWSIENTGSSLQYNGTAGNDMNVVNAWGITTGSSAIKVAILDEGCDLTHPDLIGNMLGGYDATNQGSGGNMSGDDAHGTACAGIVAAVGNNSTGSVGVAYSCKIVPVRIAYSDAQGNWVTSNSWIGNALNWAWQTANADVLSNSWGGGSYSSTIVSAINGAHNNGRGGLGAPVIFAAGNDNSTVSFPATEVNTISVAAMSMCEERKNPSSCDGENWWGSNFGTNLDVAAPGVKIATSDISGSAGYSSGDYTTTFNGTSSACPNTAGVMALILSANPALTSTQARDAMETTCDKVGGYTYNSSVSGQPNGTWSTNLGYGRVNAYAAVLSVQNNGPNDAGIAAITQPSGTVCGTSVQPTVTLQNFGNNTLNSVTFNYSLDGGSVVQSSWTGSLASGGTTSASLPSVSLTDGAHVLDVWTTNPNGVTDTDSGNDAAQVAFNSASHQVELTITFDNYPEETSWEITDPNTSQVLASGGTYGSQADGSTLVVTACLSSGCYNFTMKDVYGDGMCCSYGNGSYTLRDAATSTILAQGGTFTSTETTNICVPVGGSPPVAAINTSNNVSCNGGNNGGATASATGGTTPYSYVWSNSQTGAVLSNVGAGTYTVTVTDNNSQTSTASIVITQPSAVSTSESHVNVSCNAGNNGSINLSVSGGVAPYTYNWSNSATTQDLSSLSSGSYSVTVTDNNGCTAFRTVAITQPSALSLSMSSVAVTVQGGSNGQASVSASGGTPAYSYNWSNSGTTATITNLSAGTYSVTVTDQNGCTATNSVNVADGPPAGGCTSTVSTFPYSQTFETQTVGAWVQSTTDNMNWTIKSGTTPSSGTGPTAAAQGTWYAYMEASSPNYPSKTAILTSPCFNLNGLSGAEMTFSYHMLGTSMGTLNVEISTNSGGSWTNIWSRSGTQGSNWLAATISLNSYVNSTVMLRFVGATGTSWSSDICIDNITVSQPAPPANYCASNGNSVADEWIQTITVGSLTNNSGSNGGYANFTAQSLTIAPGASASVSLSPGFSGSTYQEFWKIWIDYNKDGDFTDANETVYTSAGSSSTVTGSFTVPAGTATGTTRMRISMKWNATPTSCESFSYGEVEDYTVIIGTAAKPSLAAATTPISTEESPRVQLFPNPASSYVNIGFLESWDTDVQVIIYDQTGNVVAIERADAGSRLHRINTSNFAAGNYLMMLQSERYSNAQRFTVIR